MTTSSHPQFIRCGRNVFPLSAVQLVRFYADGNEPNIRISILDVADLYFEGAEAERLWGFFRDKAPTDFSTDLTISTERHNQ